MWIDGGRQQGLDLDPASRHILGNITQEGLGRQDAQAVTLWCAAYSGTTSKEYRKQTQ
jgi:hypothetical protein